MNSKIKHLESKLSLITTHCLRIFVVVYRVEMLSDTCVSSIIVISTVINQLECKVSLKTICCLRLLVVV